MRQIYTTGLLSGLGFFCSAVVYADSWDITQTVNLSSSTTIIQESNILSFQSVNAISLDDTSGIVSSASQSVTLNGNNLTLRQSNNTNSLQSVNYISASEITQASQTVSGVNNITLESNNGNGNIQGVNIASAETIDELNQTVSANSFDFIGSGSDNIQAGNYLQTTNASGIAGNITQNFLIQNAGGVQYQQTGSDNIQAGNVLIRNPGFAGNVEQTFSVDQVIINPATTTDGNDSIMAANYTN